MLLQLYPRVHRRYLSLPVLGPIVEDFGAWLLNEGYSTDCIREHFCCMRRIALLLHKRGVRSVGELTKANLRACGPAQRLDDRRLASSVRLMERYFASGRMVLDSARCGIVLALPVFRVRGRTDSSELRCSKND